MPGRPETRVRELLAQIKNLSSRDLVNTFLLKGLERQARQVLAADQFGGLMLLGALAAAQGDVKEMRANHEKALQLAPRSPDALQNFAISLLKVGAFDEAASMASRA